MGRPAVDLIGQRFDRLVVIERVPNLTGNDAKWLCECECGGTTEALSHNLKSKQTRSCGCLMKPGNNFKHGFHKHKLYNVYTNMMSRCYGEHLKVHNYHRYGGRGIKVCLLWRESMTHFFKFALDNGWEEGLQIDRIDNDGNYEPDNVRFVTPSENVRNK